MWIVDINIIYTKTNSEIVYSIMHSVWVCLDTHYQAGLGADVIPTPARRNPFTLSVLTELRRNPQKGGFQIE